ncbi:DNA oxidative demethylase ALKBH2 [Saliniradius amylolyticus]|uniref:DNA oxidative demethylase ALKBH2 n=1 Tax=Saliniradius amylolyticus TaxID=2183582 RepID=A0A2S2E019_9ALTE|nr:alpha-ketoglutarate-dependent dioxygenase AlkB [Saliniradius amylolyticus]AWL10949.1 DNA oxidative demethylase ALKBH2 [Saliniradius amylolyticus]
MQASLFGPEPVELPDATLDYFPEAYDRAQADELLAQLMTQLHWRQDRICLYGKKVNIPRLQAWYGDSSANYRYSGLTMQPRPWLPVLEAIKLRCERLADCRFNSVLANLYRDGNDAMGWHSDDEPELGSRPVIASVSFGAERGFDLRHKKTGQKVRLPLAHGSVLIMRGDTQKCWQHGMARTKKITSPRVNLTFRWIHSVE